jgi:small multidrug resistance pump
MIALGTSAELEKQPMNSQVFPWLLIAASVVAEVAGTIALRFANGFTRLFPSVAVFLLYGAAIWLMSLAVRRLAIGLAYAVWAGSSTALIALVGILYFNESAHAVRLLGLAFIVIGVVTLNVSVR